MCFGCVDMPVIGYDGQGYPCPGLPHLRVYMVSIPMTISDAQFPESFCIHVDKRDSQNLDLQGVTILQAVVLCLPIIGYVSDIQTITKHALPLDRLISSSFLTSYCSIIARLCCDYDSVEALSLFSEMSSRVCLPRIHDLNHMNRLRLLISSRR